MGATFSPGEVLSFAALASAGLALAACAVGVNVVFRQRVALFAFGLLGVPVTALVPKHVIDVVALSIPSQINQGVVRLDAVAMAPDHSLRPGADKCFKDKMMNLAAVPDMGTFTIEGDLKILGFLRSSQTLTHYVAGIYAAAERVKEFASAHLSTIRYLVSGMSGNGFPNLWVGHGTEYTPKGT